MTPPDLRERFASYLPFVIVAVAGQLSVGWPPGPSEPVAYLISSLFLLAILALILVRRGMPPRTFVVGSALYMASVALLMLSAGGMSSGLGILLFMPVVGVALYGKRWESVLLVAFLLTAMLTTTMATTGSTFDVALFRRLVLTGTFAIMLSFAIQLLRSRLVASNVQTERLLQHEEALNDAVRQLVQLSQPPQITALGAQLALGIAAPPGSEILRSAYFRIEDDMVVVDAQYDDFGSNIAGSWPVAEHPGLREAVATRQPVQAPLDRAHAGPTLQPVFDASGISAGAWVPVCPNGELHGILAIATRTESIPKECVDRCVALGHFLELALSNWSAHRRLEEQATMEERRRIARELHDGLAHELAFIASKTRGAAKAEAKAEANAEANADATADANTGSSPDVRALAGAADRALDEARRAITVLSVSQPQSLDAAISQTVEDLGSRLGVAWDLELADGVDVPGEVTENLLRIVREAITNAACHGASAHVRVSLERDDHLRLVIEDDGCGFDPEQSAALGGFGLQSMQERAASVGAVLSVDSVPDHGTRVAVAFG